MEAPLDSSFKAPKEFCIKVFKFEEHLKIQRTFEDCLKNTKNIEFLNKLKA